MKQFLALASACLILSACTPPPPPLPEEPDINVNGTYLGRIVGSDERSALLDVTMTENNLNVSVTAVSQVNGQTLTLTGTRSIYKASPVTVNVTKEVTAADSPCPEQLSERYAAGMTFYAKTKTRDEGATGSVTHEICDAATSSLKAVNDGSGSLELVRR